MKDGREKEKTIVDRTKIEWCDSTWNPVTGCRHGCSYCYARRIATRFGNKPDGEGKNHFLAQPETSTPYPYGFDPTFKEYMQEKPKSWKKPRTIFVCSMADLFGNWIPDEWIEKVFATCESAPQHRYLFLTKNPQRYIDLATAGKLPAKDNMWYGTTATTPDEHFFWGGAWHTFVSIEPILRDYSGEIGRMCDTFAQWVIIGAETGNRKEKVVPEKNWIDAILETCFINNINVFMKDSLIPIVGEENMFRCFPWERETWETEREKRWLDKYYEETCEL